MEKDGVRGQHQWGMTPRPIKRFIWGVSGDVGTCRGGGWEERWKKGENQECDRKIRIWDTVTSEI